MYLRDEVYDEIFDYFRVPEPDRTTLIDLLREFQIEYLLKNFLVWYAETKSPREQKVLTNITSELDDTAEEAALAAKKLGTLFAACLNNDPTLREYLERRQATFVVEMLNAWIPPDQIELAQKVTAQLFKNYGLVKYAIDQGQIPPSKLNPLLQKNLI